MKKFFAFVFVFVLLSILSACGSNVASISVDETTVPESVEVGRLNLEDIKIIVSYKDGTNETISLSIDMIKGNKDFMNIEGEHELVIKYGKQTTNLKITITDNLNEVINAINLLPSNITYEDVEKISEIRKLYDALSDENKALVNNYNRLLDCESIARVDLARFLINSIPNDITISDLDLILEAETAYNALINNEKYNISNKNKLEDALEKLEVILLEGGKDVTFEVNGGYWTGEYKSHFEAACSFSVKAFNSSAGAKWGQKIVLAEKGDPSAAGLYWDRIYFKYDNKIKEYVVTGKLSSGGKFDETPEYEYSIGYNSTNTESAEIVNAYLNAFNEIIVGDILDISGINLDKAKYGACNAMFKVYHIDQLKVSITGHYEITDELPVLKSPILEFTGWYTNPECVGEPLEKISSRYDVLYAGWEEKVKIEKIELTNKIEDILRYGEHALSWKISPSDASVQTVKFEISDESIIKINSKGELSALKEGRAHVKIVSTINPNVFDEFDIEVYTPGRIEAKYLSTSVVELGKTISINAEYAGRVEGEIVYSSDDESVITVNSNGVVTGLKAGCANVIITCADVKVEIGVTVVEKIESLDPLIQYLISTTQYNVLSFTAVSYGSPSTYGPEFSENPYYADILGSVNNYLFEELDITEMIVPETNDNRPAIVRDKAYIVVHDTGTYTNALAYNFANNMHSTSSDTSWHYTVGNDGIFHTIPDNEAAFHAGDGRREYELEATGIKATTSAEDALIEINEQGYYTINGNDTKLRPYILENGVEKQDPNIYKTSQINSQGIRCVVKDGYYYLGKTWFSSDYQFIANYGGNRNGIGIESSVSLGTDYYYTWQKLAKLVACLMDQNNLTINDVKGHHFFSGKPCPQVILWNDSWNHFIELVKTEYEIRTTYKDYTIQLSFDNSTLMDSNGRLNRENNSNCITYTITVKKGNESHSITLSSLVPGLYTL